MQKRMSYNAYHNRAYGFDCQLFMGKFAMLKHNGQKTRNVKVCQQPNP